MRKKEFFQLYEPWLRFIDYIKGKNRFIMSKEIEQFLQKILETTDKRKVILKKKRIFFRARIGAYWPSRPFWPDKWSSLYPHPLPCSKMGPPPRDISKGGRVNPEGISYLYLSSSKKTAISEVRPWIKEFVTVGVFELNRDQKIVDATKELRGSSQKKKIAHYLEYNDYLTWKNINYEFSKPVSTTDNKLEYLPTQYLAELFKNAGYDGVKYNSSVSRTGYNLVLFNPKVAKCTKCQLFSIKEIVYKFGSTGRVETREEMQMRRFY
ncbi:MAG: hypothetical protein DRP72_00340 [Candidatus Omnitrophota bacterium]|nr:MAG: hypothetical protein DRP72_00340 [Candidatus Omnitrophota bacterium]